MLVVHQHCARPRDLRSARNPRRQLRSRGLWGEERVKQVFRDVCVDAHYAEYEADAYARMNALTDAVPEETSPSGDAVLRRSSAFIQKKMTSAQSNCNFRFNQSYTGSIFALEGVVHTL